MKQVMYSIKDKLVGFGQPFFIPNEGWPDEIAMRTVKTSISSMSEVDKENKLMHLSLCRLGTYDSEFGSFDTPDEPYTVCDCIDLFEDNDNG